MDTHETKIYAAILIASIILAIFFVYFLLTLVKHQKEKAQLYKQQVKVEISTLERERKRMAEDLHDNLGPTLSSIKLQINSLESSNADDQEIITTAGRHIDSIVQKVRETANDLLPNVLVRKGLTRALDEFFAAINSAGKITVYSHLPLTLSIQKHNEVHVYRIIQEMVNNSIKHAGASEIIVSSKQTKKGIELSIADNGKGFNYKLMSGESMGLGLSNILSRADLIGSDLFVDTSPGHGVKYTLHLPAATL